MYKNGSDFLNKLYSNMHMEKSIMHTARKSDTPEEKISRYLDRLERIHNRAKDDKHKMDILKEYYYKKYIIQELPESYVNLQKSIFRGEGHGNLQVTTDIKKRYLEEIQENQKKSLDSWIEYLSSDDAMYPMWFKNYAFQGMIKLSNFDKEKREFGKRTKTTTNPYIELNREVLALIYNILSSEVGNKTLTDEEIKALENGISFKKLYTYYLTKQNYKEAKNKSNEGIWVKYDQGSDSKILCDSLQGKNTGWCTAGYEIAKSQLKNGDFYIYYTKNDSGEFSEPRIAIRMEDKNEILEVRGVSKDQNLEEEMIDIAEKKLDEFPDKEKYKKKVHDMKYLTLIEKKINLNQDLTMKELKFLYEIDYRIEGFGWKKDPRIEEIQNMRNRRKDLAYIFNCPENKIATNTDEFLESLNNGIQIEYCSSYLDLTDIETADNIIFPKKSSDSIYLSNLKKANEIIVYKDFDQYIDMEHLNNVQKLVVKENFKGRLILSNLKSVKDLTILKNCSGSISLEQLKSAFGLKISNNFSGYLNLSGLQTTLGLNLSNDFVGTLNLDGIKSLYNFKFPERLSGLFLQSLEEISNVSFPKYLGNDLNLSSLQKNSNMIFPEYIDGDLILLNLKTAKNIKFPKYINGTLEINRLRNTEVLELPESYKDNVEVITFAKIKYVPDEIYFNEEKEKNIIHK